jgi:hypothetical protein
VTDAQASLEELEVHARLLAQEHAAFQQNVLYWQGLVHMGGLSAPPPLPPQGSTRFAYVAFAILQCFLGAGIIFGWTSIIPVLEQERIYGELCAPDERGTFA